MDIGNIAPKIYSVSDIILKNPWYLKNVSSSYFELLYVKSGSIKINIDGIEYTGTKGDIFLIKPKQNIDIRISDGQDFHQLSVKFDLYFYESFDKLKHLTAVSHLKKELDNLPSKLSLYYPNQYEKLFELFRLENSQRVLYFELVSKGIFISLLGNIIREVHLYNNATVLTQLDALISIKEYIYNNLDKDLSLDDLSQQVKFSKHHLVRIFHAAFGISPIKYHQNLRIDKAKELLIFTELSITQIGEKLGYANINSFSRAYKNVEGISPKQFRNKSI